MGNNVGLTRFALPDQRLGFFDPPKKSKQMENKRENKDFAHVASARFSRAEN